RIALITVAAAAPNDAKGLSDTSNAVDDASYGRLNAIDRAFAVQHPGDVIVEDLASRLCPNGPPCPEQVNGLRMRPDGRHFSPTAATIEARWLFPSLVQVAGKGHP